MSARLIGTYHEPIFTGLVCLGATADAAKSLPIRRPAAIRLLPEIGIEEFQRLVLIRFCLARADARGRFARSADRCGEGSRGWSEQI